MLDNIRSALNVGAIFRTADGAGASKLYLCGITPTPPHAKIPKTALGAVEHVSWERYDSTAQLVMKLKQEGVTTVAIEQSNRSTLYTNYHFKSATAIIFGNEITGVDPKVLEIADHVIELPMYGHKNSLNVATTVGIISYYAASFYA